MRAADAPIAARPWLPSGNLLGHAPAALLLAEGARLAPVLLLPLVAHLIDPIWLYTRAGSIDPWLYFAVAANFEVTTRYFADNYYFTRFAWTLPGAALYGLFDPLTAKYLWHFLFFYLATLSLYGTLRPAGGYAVALGGVVILSFDRVFVRSLGWDYVDGAGAAYALLTLCLLTAASRRGTRSKLFVAVGFAFGLLVNTYLSMIVFLPCFLLYAAVILRRHGQASLATLRRPGLAIGLGLGLSVLLAAAINWHYTGRADYLGPSLDIVREVVERNLYPSPPLATRAARALWAEEGRWLQVPVMVAALAAVSAIAARARRRRLPTLAAAAFAYYGSTVALWLTLEVVGRSMSAHYFHFTYLYPGMYLALAALLGQALAGLGRAWQAGVVGVLLAGAVAGAARTMGPGTAEALRVASLAWVAASLAWVVAEAVPRRLLRPSALLVGVILASLFLRGDSAWRWRPTEAADDRAVYLAVVEAVGAIREVFPDRKPYFMYPDSSGDGYLGLAISSSFFWASTLVTQKLPVLDCKDLRSMPATPAIVVMGPEETVAGVGTLVLDACGFDARPVAAHRIDQGPAPYFLYFYSGARRP